MCAKTTVCSPPLKRFRMQAKIQAAFAESETMQSTIRRPWTALLLAAAICMAPLLPTVAAAGEEAAPPPDPTTSLEGSWLAEDLFGGGVIDNLRTVLEIGPDGQVSGNGGCNAIAGRAEIDGTMLRFSDIVSTQKLCVPAAMDQERKFFDALEAARGWSVDAARGKLLLQDRDGEQVAVFSRDG